MASIRNGRVGRMFRALFHLRAARIFAAFSKACAVLSMNLFQSLNLKSGQTQEKSWVTVTPSPGESLTRNSGESPNAENASTLSQILQVGVPEKYYLSQRACLGILRRASARGKQLPEILRIALERQASASTGTTEA